MLALVPGLSAPVDIRICGRLAVFSSLLHASPFGVVKETEVVQDDAEVLAKHGRTLQLPQLSIELPFNERLFGVCILKLF